MDIAKSVTFIFEDPDWISKVLIGSLILLVSLILSPILIGLVGLAIITGYSLEIVKNVRSGRSTLLPAWRDKWGEWLVLGLKLWIVVFVWSLPGLIMNIPMSLADTLMQQGEGASVIGGLIVACFGCLSFLWWVILALASPALYINVAETGKISSGFQFAQIFDFTKENIGEVILAVIVAAIISFFLFILGAIAGTLLCVVGLIIMLPAAMLLSTLVQAHLYAQIGLKKSRGPARPADDYDFDRVATPVESMAEVVDQAEAAAVEVKSVADEVVESTGDVVEEIVDDGSEDKPAE